MLRPLAGRGFRALSTYKLEPSSKLLPPNTFQVQRDPITLLPLVHDHVPDVDEKRPKNKASAAKRRETRGRKTRWSAALDAALLSKDSSTMFSSIKAEFDVEFTFKELKTRKKVLELAERGDIDFAPTYDAPDLDYSLFRGVDSSYLKSDFVRSLNLEKKLYERVGYRDKVTTSPTNLNYVA